MENKNAGFFIRMLAKIQDTLVNMLLLALLMAFTTKSIAWGTLNYDLVNAGTAFLMFLFLLPPLYITYNVYFVSIYGGTLGKLLFGLKIVNKDSGELISKKEAFYRTVLGYNFSGKLFGVGFWQIARNKENLGWHDELFNTKVVRENAPWLGILAILLTIAVLGIVLAHTGYNILGQIPAELIPQNLIK